jgi:hypothetical protein
VPRAKPPELTSPAERQRIADGAANPKRDYEPALEVLGIAEGDRRKRAREMLQQVAANYLVDYAVTVSIAAEETPARQRATLKAVRRLIKGQAKKGYPNPFFPHTEPRHPAALPATLETAIARELRAIELATPELPLAEKYIKAIDAVIARLERDVSTGRKRNWALDNMLDQLMGVAAHLDPSIAEKRNRMRQWKFIIAFMVDAMGMTQPGIDHHRSRANKLLPDLRREAPWKKLMKTEQGQAAAARDRETKKQNEQLTELLRKLQGRGA